MKRIVVFLFFATAMQAQFPSRVWIVAHRGFKAVAPENTIAAFDAAARAGADYMEVDVRPTRDGELVLMHDSDVDRTTNGSGAVRDLTFAAIRKLDAGKGRQVPTFREALLWAKTAGRRIDVDHKDGPVEDVARAIAETGMTRMVVIEGPRENLIRFAELLPGVDTMPKVASVAGIRDVCRSLHTTVIRLSLQQLAIREAVEAVHACGARVAVTILGNGDNEQTMRRIVALGAQVIETDHPDILAKVRREVRPSAP